MAYTVETVAFPPRTGPSAPRVINPLKVVFGVQEPKPVEGLPAGKVRIRMRNTSPARAYVRTENGIRHFILVDQGDHWYADPRLEQGRNVRITPKTP